MALKFVVLKKGKSVTGRERWSLDGPAGEVSAFRHWQDEIQERLSYETRKAYSIAVAQFIDYLYEVAAFAGQPLTPKRARELVEGYKTLLEKGGNAGAQWLRQVASALPHHLPVKPRSANLKLTAIYGFLEECEDLYDEAVERLSDGESPVCNPYTEALGGLAHAGRRDLIETHKLRQNSMLGGVIRNAAAGLKKKRRLSVRQPSPLPWDDTRMEFPLDQIGLVIEAARSYRDKALYTLLACGGLRTHEALQLRVSSLHWDSLRVDLHDFLYGANVTPHELRKKGRSARFVYFWPGYDELFFWYVTRYLQTERRHRVGDPNDFLFVKIKPGETRGQPLYTATDKARDDSFKLAQKRAGIPLINGIGYGLHSLRHSYGVFMVNHCPWENGQIGLPIEVVQRMMGHDSRLSTEHYARTEKYKIDAVLKAGRRLYGQAGLEPSTFRECLANSLIKEAQRLISLSGPQTKALEEWQQ